MIALSCACGAGSPPEIQCNAHLESFALPPGACVQLKIGFALACGAYALKANAITIVNIKIFVMLGSTIVMGMLLMHN